VHNEQDKWLMFDEVVEGYSPYRIANLGSRYINPRNIIGFSLSEKEILNSGKLMYLSENVKVQGWKPIHLQDFELILLPNGKFTVGNGGNHRAYLSKQLTLESIPAHIEVLIPQNLMSESTIKKIKELEEEQSIYDKKAYELNMLLISKGSSRVNYLAEEEELNSLYSRSDLKNITINQLLLIEASNLGYLSKELLEGTI